MKQNTVYLLLTLALSTGLLSACSHPGSNQPGKPPPVSPAPPQLVNAVNQAAAPVSPPPQTPQGESPSVPPVPTPDSSSSGNSTASPENTSASCLNPAYPSHIEMKASYFSFRTYFNISGD